MLRGERQTVRIRLTLRRAPALVAHLQVIKALFSGQEVIIDVSVDHWLRCELSARGARSPLPKVRRPAVPGKAGHNHDKHNSRDNFTVIGTFLAFVSQGSLGEPLTGDLRYLLLIWLSLAIITTVPGVHFQKLRSSSFLSKLWSRINFCANLTCSRAYSSAHPLM